MREKTYSSGMNTGDDMDYKVNATIEEKTAHVINDISISEQDRNERVVSGMITNDKGGDKAPLGNQSPSSA
jgi:hypothetical protein